MRNQIINEIKKDLSGKGAITTFTILCAMVILNYLNNIRSYSGCDIALMYDSVKLILPSFNNAYGWAQYLMIFSFLFPILVIMPSGFTYINDEKTGIAIYSISRIGIKKYISVKVISGFIATFVVFLIPLLIDFFLTYTTFPRDASCDLSNWGCYSEEYALMIDNYWGSNIFLRHKIIYTIYGIIRICFLAGFFGVFPIALSYFYSFRFRFFLFFPCFILINGTVYLNTLFYEKGLSLDIYSYVLIFNDDNKLWLIFYLYIAMVLLADIVLIWIGTKRRRNRVGI